MTGQVWHVVTERPMFEGQRLLMDMNHPNGVSRRVAEWQKINRGEPAGDASLRALIAADPERWAKVARRELAMERIRAERFSEYPSRMCCLYTSRTREAAQNWADYFRRIGRSVYGIALLQINGRLFDGDACHCFDGTEDESENLKRALRYWQNDPPSPNPIIETLADGEILVLKILNEPTELIQNGQQKHIR